MPKIVTAGSAARSAILCLLGTLASPAVLGQAKVLINPGDQGGQARAAAFTHWKVALEKSLRRADAAAVVAVTMSNDTTADLSATRARIPDIVVGPAHLVGSALRYGYVPVLGLAAPEQTVLVVPASSKAKAFGDLRALRLGLPLQDSLVTYLVRGEANAANTTIKRHFKSTYQTRWQDALLTCLQMQQCDVVAVDRALFDRWAAAGQPVRMVLETRTAPALSVAVRNDAKISPAALGAALAEALVADGASERGQWRSLSASDFSYVSTLGYFTPRSLPGATVVDARAVAELLQKNGRYIDTRTEPEFQQGHVPGSVLVPYVEKSAKDADFLVEQDQFDLAKLGTDLATPLVFGCNGAECWKSYKASIAAMKAGYSRVHWFRGGFPEWRETHAEKNAARSQ